MDDLITCPNCQAQLPLISGSTKISCGNCHWEFETLHHLCPSCGTYHHLEAAICLECGTPLERMCQHCYTINWSGRQTCSECKSSLDLVESIIGLRSRTTSARLQQQMAEARVLKAIERHDSDQRMAAFNQLEKDRRRAITENLTRQKYQERKLLMVTAFAVVVFFVALLIYSLIY